MRRPKFISPSAYGKWKKNPQEYYLMYLSDNRPDKMPQTKPMVVGGAFDVFVKRRIVEHFGLGNFDFDAMMKNAVEQEELHLWALDNGEYVFECYCKSGAMSDLLLEMEDFKGTPRLESKIEGIIQGVPILGKPDLEFTNKCDRNIVLDWKVNGYCSKSGASPSKGFTKCRDSWDHKLIKPSKTHGHAHKDAQVILTDGIWLNVAHLLEDMNTDFATQLSMYAWVLGEPIGGDFIVAIEQVCAKNLADFEKPLLRIASHRVKVGAAFQTRLMEDLKEMWKIINSDWIFREMPEAESQEKQLLFDKYSEALAGDGTPEDKWFQETTRFQ